MFFLKKSSFFFRSISLQKNIVKKSFLAFFDFFVICCVASFAEVTESVPNDDSSFAAVDSGIRPSFVGPDTQACTPPDWPKINA